MIKYFLWIRWKSGSKDCFEITTVVYEQLKEGQLDGLKNGNWWLNTPSGEKLELNFSEMVAWKLITKKFNPLEDEAEYDDPLN